ncbi:hypothetical protein HGRIS_007714 [Hohenbuehelia grisea]|uniref:F-box domain-containing protein n=1 Tax=Hohenbuehelia grisea TaxID=104357 RepID=A0ABR3J628_9AGAR
MGEYWFLVNVDKRKRSSSFSNLSTFFFMSLGYKDSITSTLTRYRLRFTKRMRRDFPNKPLKMSTLGNLSKLPMELVRMIFDEIDDIQDLICLILTSHTLFCLGLNRLHQLADLLSATHSWRGDRIVLYGDWSTDDDAPKGLLTEDDLKFLEERGIGWGSIKDRENGYEEENSASEPGLGKYLASRDRDIDMWDQADSADVRRYFHIIDSNNFYAEKPVLLNLSKKLYVVSEAFEKATGRFGLGNALQTRICWTTVYPDSRDPPVCRGAWAGDRFILEDQAYVDRLVNDGEEWTDVTEEIAKELMTYWENREEY